MYQKLPNLVIGFHGCSKTVFDEVIKNGGVLRKSTNSYDWLGHGIYFWEQNYQRALEWAINRNGKDAAVIGAVIDLGYCLNLTDSVSTEKLNQGYELLKLRCDLNGDKLPKNTAVNGSIDLLKRDLDCAVIQQIHDFNKQNDRQEYDSVRGIFEEGGPAYPGSAFKEKTHVQLCICNPNCIKGYFAPIKANSEYQMP